GSFAGSNVVCCLLRRHRYVIGSVLPQRCMEPSETCRGAVKVTPLTMMTFDISVIGRTRSPPCSRSRSGARAQPLARLSNRRGSVIEVERDVAIAHDANN